MSLKPTELQPINKTTTPSEAFQRFLIVSLKPMNKLRTQKWACFKNSISFTQNANK